MKQIIFSALQNDAYKFSMGQCFFHQHNGKIVSWTFKCRNKDVKFTPEMVEEIKRQVKLYSEIRFTKEELDWLKSNMIWIHQDYLDFLKLWHPDFNDIKIGTDSPCGLTVEYTGSASNVTFYETPIMAIICEVFYRMDGAGPFAQVEADFLKQIDDNIKKIWDGEVDIGSFSEFGFRRAAAQYLHDELIRRMVEGKVPGFLGTSNVYLAKKYGIKAMGTMAHESEMVIGQGYPERNPAYGNKYLLDSWVKEYGILNGIALTDTIGTDVFLKDFQLTFATLFSGVRHDSGDPYVWGDKIIAHYKSLGIDPMTKTLLFSDSLSLEKADAIKEYFDGKAKVAFGIGGAFASPKGKELNIVIKPFEVDGRPVAKLSDAPGKNMCKDPEYIEYLNRSIDWRLNH